MPEIISNIPPSEGHTGGFRTVFSVARDQGLT